MNEDMFLDGISNLDTDIVDSFFAMDDRLQKNAKAAKTKRWWLRIGVTAACFALMISAIIVLPMLTDSGNNPNSVPPVSLIPGSNNITANQEFIYGNITEYTAGNASKIPAGFYMRTIVHANVIEVLPDSFYEPGPFQIPYFVARLSVVEAIRGDGLPDEILLRFPNHPSDIFDGYDTFIFSLQQIGVENYMMINNTKGEIAYFPHMFEAVYADFKIGTVIAFKDDIADSNFPSNNPYHGKSFDYVQSNIKYLLARNESRYIVNLPCDYVTSEDIFNCENTKQMQTYLNPSLTNTFMHRIGINQDRVTAIYTRIVNGFETEEEIIINGYVNGNGSVLRKGDIYSTEDLANVPNLEEAIKNLNLFERDPPHLKIDNRMELKFASVWGVYRKINGRMYGAVRVIWCYKHPDTLGYVEDDCYFLYDDEGNGTVLERDTLRDLLGDDAIDAVI